MKQLIFFFTLICLSPVYAEEWMVPLKEKTRPNNHPGKKFVKVNDGLDAFGFTMNLEGEKQVGVRVRNTKHKRGPRNISIDLGNANMLVQRVDILKPIAKIEALGDGEHLMDTFKSDGKTFKIFCKVTKGKLEQNLIIRPKK